MPPINPIYISELVSTFIIGGGGLCTALLAYFGVWKKIIQPWMKSSSEKRDRMNNVVAHVEDIVTKLDKVSKELMPNGGGSIKDQVKEISRDVKAIRVERNATFLLAKEPMFKNDAKGYCTLANQALCKLYGTNQEQLLGLGWLNYVIEEDRERVKEEWKNIIESGTEITSNYTVKNDQTDQYIPVKYRAIINRDNESIISAIGYVEKIPERKLNKLLTKDVA